MANISLEGIVCIGGANADRKIKLENAVQWHTSNPAQTHFASGGVARNIAENLVRLQCPASLITILGEDHDGEQLYRELEMLGVDLQFSQTLPGHRTGSYISILDARGEMVLATADMGIYDHFSLEWLEEIWESLTTAEWFFIDTNLPADSLQWLIQKARHSQVKLCLDPVSAPKTSKLPQHLEGIEIIFPDIHEAEALSQISWEGKQSCQKIHDALKRRGVLKFVLSLGKEGVFAATEKETQWLPALQVPVKDITGAGDALAAGVIWGLQQGFPFFEACEMGIRNAALTIQIENTVNPMLTPKLLTDFPVNLT